MRWSSHELWGWRVDIVRPCQPNWHYHRSLWTLHMDVYGINLCGNVFRVVRCWCWLLCRRMNYGQCSVVRLWTKLFCCLSNSLFPNGARVGDFVGGVKFCEYLTLVLSSFGGWWIYVVDFSVACFTQLSLFPLCLHPSNPQVISRYNKFCCNPPTLLEGQFTWHSMSCINCIMHMDRFITYWINWYNTRWRPGLGSACLRNVTMTAVKCLLPGVIRPFCKRGHCYYLDLHAPLQLPFIKYMPLLP